MPTPPPIACPHAPACPGCAGIGRPLAALLDEKSARVAAAIGAFPALQPLAPAPIRAADAVVDYRTRAKLVVATGARIGLYARGGHDVLDLPQCRVLAPAIAEALAALRALVAKPPPDAVAALAPDGERDGRLRALDLREVRDEAGAGVLLTLVVRAPRPARAALDAACDALERAIPSLRTIALSLHDGRSPRLLGAAPQVLRGPALQRDQLRDGAPWSFAAPGGFAQAHRAQAAAIHAELERVLAPPPHELRSPAARCASTGPPAGLLAGRRVLELFAGSGALGLALAARGAHVTQVESFATASEAALAAAREQGLAAHVRALAETAESATERLHAAGERFDAVIANPPRRGIPPRMRESIAGLARRRIAYVSCEPATLARDLAHLADLGWRAETLVPFDMMPLTAEVECVAVLTRAAPPPLAILHDGGDLLAVAKPPFLATVPHPEREGSLLARVRALPGAEHAVPLHRLDAGTSGVCLFVRRAEAAAAWQRALAEPTTSKCYLALVRGIGRAKGRIARPLREDGRTLDAATRYRRLEVIGGHALLEVTLETGRTHQIRRHLASIGNPVLGDARHGHAASNRHVFERWFLDRPFLHCASIEVVDPAGGALLRIESALAADLAAVLTRLR